MDSTDRNQEIAAMFRLYRGESPRFCRKRLDADTNVKNFSSTKQLRGRCFEKASRDLGGLGSRGRVGAKRERAHLHMRAKTSTKVS